MPLQRLTPRSRPRGLSLQFLIFTAVLLACTTSACSHQEALPVLSTLPSFSLTASDGTTITDANMRGQVWVANFIYTQCPGVCPLLSAEMAKLQKQLGTNERQQVQLISVSVDPSHDTPPVLQSYAARFHADAKRWRFLTGDRVALYTLIGKGFLLAVAEEAPAADAPPSQELITHSDRFALVDRQLQVRGYYRPLEDGAMEHLLRDVDRLLSDH